MIAQSYATVADLFGRPVFEWVPRREHAKIAEWLDEPPLIEPLSFAPEALLDLDEYQEPLKEMRKRRLAERKAKRLCYNAGA